MTRARPSITMSQRRARLGIRHRLAPQSRAGDPVEVARSVVALHATDPATVHLSVLARMHPRDVALTEQALYQERSLLRLLGMRRSMFVVPAQTAPVLQAACTTAIAAAQRRLLIKHLAELGDADLIGPDPGAWLAEVELATLTALRARGSATAAELASDEPRLTAKLGMADGKPYAATVNITSRVLFLLGADARIIRGRPRGSWISSQYVWHPMDCWLDGGLPKLEPGPAQAELVRQWLAAFGPGQVADIAWWSGLGLRQVRTALAALDVTDVDLGDGQAGFVLPGDEDDPGPTPPWAALLPGLDPAPMGWKARDWYLGEHAPRVTDRTGNIGATVWWNGQVVGGWAQRPNGEIVYRLLEDIGSEGAAAVQDAAADLAEGIGGARVVPRFPAPLDRELRS